MSQHYIIAKDLSRYFRQYKKEPGLGGSIKSLFNRQYFEIRAVDRITLSIDEGESVGFIGPNGAGKTTTLKMFSGLLYPTSGSLSVLGYQPVQRRKEFLKSYSLVMGQRSQLWWDLPPMEGFILNKEIYEVEDDPFKRRVDELSKLLEVEGVLDVPVRKLSLGQRMKCELIAALIHRPKILFLDEPTIGLDVVVQKRMCAFLKRYNADSGATVILTSHNMDDVQELCSRIIVINGGRVIFDDSLKSLTQKYAQRKYLKMIFNQKVARADVERYGHIVECADDGLSATLSVERSQHTQVAGKILGELPVDDLDIAEADLKEIIAKMFKRHG